jgi:hypothetical protein
MGADSEGQRAAALYSLIGTARLNGIDPAFYLRTVLATIAEHPINRIQETPAAEQSPPHSRTTLPKPLSPTQQVSIQKVSGRMLDTLRSHQAGNFEELRTLTVYIS